MADNHKEKLKNIIEKLTRKSMSVFSEKIFLEAGELGIGEMHVQRMIDELLEEDYLMFPMRGVIKRKI
jgi:DNA replicative helicase MCM subunit Mcm2 (Cdc46/Mcm family)